MPISAYQMVSSIIMSFPFYLLNSSPFSFSISQRLVDQNKIIMWAALLSHLSVFSSTVLVRVLDLDPRELN